MSNYNYYSGNNDYTYENKEKPKKASRTVYTTKLINKLLEDHSNGYEIPYDAFFNRDLELRAKGIVFEMTQEEVEEYNKCYDDPLYYISTYCKFQTDNDYQLVELRDFQKKVINIVTEETWIPSLDDFGPKNRNIIWMAARQSGKTTTIAAFMSWMLIFHNSRNILIAANKEDTAKEIIDKITKVFRKLPFFLKPGCDNFGKLGLVLENDSKLLSTATTNTASIGFTIHCVLFDEFAHVPANIIDNFWRSVYPTLSSSKVSQCIITSTPNGTTNKFYEIWSKSLEGKNSFVNIRTDYWEVPDHDEEWAAAQRADFGETEFAQEFELQFNINSKMLLGPTEMQFINKMSKPFVHKPIFIKSQYLNHDKLTWHPDFNPNDIDRNAKYALLIDLAEGNNEDDTKKGNKNKEPDSNTITIVKIVPNSIANIRRYSDESCAVKDAFRYVQIGKWTSNTDDEVFCAKVAAALTYDLFNDHLLDNVRVMVEMNFNGKSFTETFAQHQYYSESSIQKTYHTKPVPGEFRKKKKGFKTTTDKEFYCLKGKKMFKQHRIIVTDIETKDQLQCFGYVKGKIKGIACHDDLSYPIVNHIPRMLAESTFIEWLSDYLYTQVDAAKRFAINQLIEKWAMDNPEMSDKEFDETYSNEDASPMNPYYEQHTSMNPYSSQDGFTYPPGFNPDNPYLSMGIQYSQGFQQNPYSEQQMTYGQLLR